MKRSTISLILFTFCVIAAAMWIWNRERGQPAAPEAKTEGIALVKTAPITQKTLTEIVESYGVIAADNAGILSISLPRNVRIARLSAVLGQEVKKGDLLLEASGDAEGNVAYTQAVTALQSAQKEYQRIKEMVGQQLATDSQLTAAEKALRDAEAALTAQKKLGNGIATQRIMAPFDGVVTSLTAAQGDRIAAGTAMLQLTARRALRAELTIEPKESSRVAPGMKVRLVSVFDPQTTAEGEITQVQRMIDSKSQGVIAYATITQDAAGLIAGGSVRGRIIVASAESPAVPAEAVLRDEKEAYLFQVADGKAQRVGIKTGLESDGFIAVEGPLDPAHKIVVSGNYELENGMRVREGEDTHAE